MEEKEVIKGESTIVLPFICVILAVIAGVFLVSSGIQLSRDMQTNSNIRIRNQNNHILGSRKYQSEESLVPDILGVMVGAGGVVISIYSFFLYKNNKIVVTNKRVYGTAAFGKRVDIPIDSISSIGTLFYNTVSVASSSGMIKFAGLENADELYKELTKITLNRNDEKVEETEKTTDITDIIRKYRSLYDEGSITKEEFEELKKKIIKQ